MIYDFPVLAILSRKIFTASLSVWLNPLQTLPHITYSCWADLPMSALETASCNFTSTCAWSHIVSRTLWSWSGCCSLWLKQKWLPSCRDLKTHPHRTEDIDFCTCSCIAIYSKLIDHRILGLWCPSISNSPLCRKLHSRILHNYFLGP